MKLLLTLIMVAFAFNAQAETEAPKSFKKCLSCHSTEEGKHKVGPSLYQIYGTTAGKQDGFKYSKSLKESEVVWDDETLNAWLENPSKFIGGRSKMMAKTKKEKTRKEIIEYLRQFAIDTNKVVEEGELNDDLVANPMTTE